LRANAGRVTDTGRTVVRGRGLSPLAPGRADERAVRTAAAVLAAARSI